MNNFNMKAAVFTAFIALVFVGWVMLSMTFPSIMTPINNIVTIGALLYTVFCIVKLYLLTNKKENQQ